MMRKIDNLCGTTEPSTMTSTNHVAIVSQILNLKDNELDTFAQFDGHAVYYALDTLKHKKHKKVNQLPLASDVQKLIGYMRQMSNKYMSDLQQAVDDR